MKFFARLSLVVFLSVFCLLGSGYATHLNLTMKNGEVASSSDLSVPAQSASPPAGEAPVVPGINAPPEKLPEQAPEKLQEQPRAAAVQQEIAATSPLPVAVKKLYAVQIKAFQNVAEAEKFTEKARETLPDIQWVRADVKRKGIWYRILVGPFCTQQEATRYRDEKGISDLYPDCFIQRINLPLQGKPRSKLQVKIQNKPQDKPQSKPQGKIREFIGP